MQPEGVQAIGQGDLAQEDPAPAIDPLGQGQLPGIDHQVPDTALEVGRAAPVKSGQVNTVELSPLDSL